ncbi:hypothetical protein SARC_05836 [Sphaeroforma arctica JP610]|uniref:C3H1-type domain-containing protein n=1 Tax=Sphaeroforma arctica JP610 TaxID=667725 RepID=A0A0L0G0Y0_9EUKA|nr:hypothetical protein SARC_05836 [Sphaeroforma arctica JP610]KNC81863.1 hypothetical protein SARC_05836 [Sphaeroforma arctica JP610]|eukprot:XP_014155765.1 hypothetical protein SARC_05836 [Sphaeroforma arctica JP610]
MSTDHEKNLLKQIAEIGAAINKRKRDAILQKVNETRRASKPSDTKVSHQASTSSGVASAQVSEHRRARPPHSAIPGGPNKKWVAKEVVDTYKPKPTASSVSGAHECTSSEHVQPYTSTTSTDANKQLNAYTSYTQTQTHTHPRPHYTPRARPPGPRGQNGQGLTWTAPGVPKQLPRGPALPRPPRAHTGARPSRAVSAAHTGTIAPAECLVKPLAPAVPSASNLLCTTNALPQFPIVGKKARVVSIGTTLFDVADDLSRLSRRIPIAVASDDDDLPERVVIGDHVYHRADANEYKRNEAKSKSYCKFYNLYGRRGCTNDPCKFLHDPDKIILCRPFVTELGCSISEGDCPLQHIHDKDRMPICTSFFIKGSCDRGDKCYDLHQKKGREIAVCKKYINGYCPNGIDCDERHHWICPDFEFRASCAAGDACPMRHYELKPKPLKRKQNHTPPGFRIPYKKMKDASKADTAVNISIKPNLESGFLRLDSDVVPIELSAKTKPIELEEKDTPALSIRPRFSFSQKRE